MTKFDKFYENVKEHFRNEVGAVEYYDQTPEQRETFIGRIQYLNAVKINRNMMADVWGHIISAQPEDKKSTMYKIFKDVIHWHKEASHAINMLDVRISNLLKTSENGKELVDQYAWYNAEIIKMLFELDNDQQSLAIDILKSLPSGDFKATSEDQHLHDMISFAAFCRNTRGNIDAEKLQQWEQFKKGGEK